MAGLHKGVNDLKTWCLSNGEFGKQLISEWTGEVEGRKNVSIDKITKASGKKAKWRCSKGHEWVVTINNRTSSKTCCPHCFNIAKAKPLEENSLKTWCLSSGSFGEQLMLEWTGEVDGKKNVGIDDVTRASQKKAKWKCSKGHEWIATIGCRTSQKTGCPYCVYKNRADKIIRNKVLAKKDLKTWCLANGEFGKTLMSEWTGEVDCECNVEIDKITMASAKKARWKCIKGHEWIATIIQRTRDKSSCPFCARDRVSDTNSLKTWCLSNGSWGEQLMSEWTGEVEGKKNIDMSDVARASAKKAKWKCSNGHEWFTTINNRASHKSGCPFCNTWGTSYPEQFIYHSLKQLYPDAKSRAKAYLPENNRGVEYDISIVCANLCIEYSPTYWHQSREERDYYKKEISKQYNFRLIQIVDDSFDELEHKFEPDYICFKMNQNQKDEILVTIVEHILKSLGHSISEIDIEQAKKDAYESSKGIENDIQDTD